MGAVMDAYTREAFAILLRYTGVQMTEREIRDAFINGDMKYVTAIYKVQEALGVAEEEAERIVDEWIDTHDRPT